MSKKKSSNPVVPLKEDFDLLPEKERLKYLAAEELGLYEKIRQGGWQSLTSSEAGKIGGRISRLRRQRTMN